MLAAKRGLGFKLVFCFSCLVFLIVLLHQTSFNQFKLKSFNVRTSNLSPRMETLAKELGQIDQRYAEILGFCGDLCDLTKEITPGKKVGWPGSVKAEVNCDAIFASDEIDRPANHDPVPFEELHTKLQEEYTFYGRIETANWYINEKQQTFSETYTYTQSEVEDYISKFLGGTPRDNYGGGSAHINLAAEHIGVKGKTVLVIGTQNPWLEAVLLSKMPKLVMTLEYGSFISEYPGLEFIRPKQFRERYINGSLPQFDAIFSYSSLEHSGLGRYGDALNPWGDIITVARVSCLAAPDAKLVLAVPTGGKDLLQYNAHRIYGPVAHPFLTTNWKFEWSSVGEEVPCPTCADGPYQPVYVFERNV